MRPLRTWLYSKTQRNCLINLGSVVFLGVYFTIYVLNSIVSIQRKLQSKMLLVNQLILNTRQNPLVWLHLYNTNDNFWRQTASSHEVITVDVTCFMQCCTIQCATDSN